MEPFPQIRIMGVSGVLVRFADTLSEAANRASLAFRAAVEAEAWPGVAETSTALASTFLRVDPLQVDPRHIAARAEALATSKDWAAMPMPKGRQLWRIPCAWGGALGPDLADAARQAGMSEAEAVAELSTTRTRVLALGFAPGQPYIGELGAHWNLPRRSSLQQVPAGAVLLAVQQFVLFAAPGPTGWCHVGQTAFATYSADADPPMPLRPGDEIVFEQARPDEITALQAKCDPRGGAIAEPLA